MRRVLPAIAFWLLVFARPCIPSAGADVPPPDKTPAEVIVHGRTATLKSIVITNVGEQIPLTHSGCRANNTTGFSWYVSQHWAFKTDYPEEKARYYLEILELAYPQYVDIFGSEPEDMERKRLTVVYGSSLDQMCRAGRSDGFNWVGFGGGGIAFPGHNVAYQYPSGGLLYHQRFILLHECSHLFQFCSSPAPWPGWFGEGHTEGMGHHVYDPVRKQLTVWVLDKAPIHNQLDNGRASILGRTPVPTFQSLAETGGGYAENFIIMQFLRNSPEYLLNYYAWRNAMIGAGATGNPRFSPTNALEGIYGGWDRLNADFKRWTDTRTNTFRYVNWAFEQDGGWYWSRGSRDWYGRTDVLITPGGNPADDRWRMDYPRDPMPPLVGPVERGTAEPSIGAMLDLSHRPDKGRVGLGLGVVTEWPVTPFARGELFLDEAGASNGIELIVYDLASAAGDAIEAGELFKGGIRASTNCATIERTSLASAVSSNTANFLAEWTGWLKVTKKADYSFGTVSDDGIWLWIDDREIVSNGGKHGLSGRHGTTALQPGLHKLRVLLYQGEGGFDIKAGFYDVDRLEPGMAMVLVEDGRNLVIEGSGCAIGTNTFPLPAAFTNALRSSGHKPGMTVKIASKALAVTLRTQVPGAAQMTEFSAEVPLDKKLRERLIGRHLSLLSQSSGGGYMDTHFGIAPYFDAGSYCDPAAILEPAPPNQFGMLNSLEASIAIESCWRLGAKAPRMLVRHRDALVAAARSGKKNRQLETARLFRQDLPVVLANIATCDADEGIRQRIPLRLFGARMALGIGRGEDGGLNLTTKLDNLGIGAATGIVSYVIHPPESLLTPPLVESVVFEAGKPTVLSQVISNKPSVSCFNVDARAELTWQGRQFILTAFRAYQPTVPQWWIIGPFDNPGGPTIDVTNAIEQQPFDADKTYTGKDGAKVRWKKVARGSAFPDDAEFIVSFNNHYPPENNAAAYARVIVHSPTEREALLAVGAEDGEIAWLNGERVLTHLCGGRAYASKSETAPVHMKKGANELLIKVTLGQGGWVLAAHVLDPDGAPMPDLRYTLE